MITISASDLRAWGACKDQVRLFKKTFGDRAEFSAESLDQARAAKLDIAWLTRNPSTPAEALRALASDADWRVRERVAGNPSTPVEVLRALASDAIVLVRKRAAGNPSTPVE